LRTIRIRLTACAPRPPLEHRLDLVDELGDVLELAVDGGEADVRDLVDAAQGVHHELPDLLRRHLAVELAVERVLDLRRDLLERVDGDGPLLAGLHETEQDLAPLEGHPRPVLLHDPERRLLDLLVGRVAPLALEALASTTDDEAVPRGPRIDHPVPIGLAERAPHRPPPSRHGRANGQAARRARTLQMVGTNAI
jgi:hypothetical protein